MNKRDISPAGLSNKMIVVGLAGGSALPIALASFLAAGPLPGVLAGLGMAVAVGGLSWFIARLDGSMRRSQRELVAVSQSLADGTAWPPMGNWALDGDALLYIAQVAQERDVRQVLECGPGVSSYFLGQLLPEARFTGLEHDSTFVQRLSDQLVRRGLSSRYTLIHAPIATKGPLKGWYDIAEGDLRDGTDFVIIDGPPSPGGKCPRGLGWEVIKPRLAPRAIVVLDDTTRRGERDIAGRLIRDGDCRLLFDGGSFMALEML